MNDVLEKLQRVKIQNKTRLSKEDQQFCQIQQKLYDSTRNHFLSMFVDMETLHQQELTFYGKVQKYADRVYQQNLICMDKKKQTELMEKVHNHFIRTIISFFNRKYGLAIQKHSYERYISLQTLAEPVLHKRDKGLQIPMEQRQNLNAKILYLVENHETELYGITPEDIFNVYMGNGGLHGLDRKDFQNFHAYTEAKKEIEQGQFFTPAEICEFLVACVKPEPKDIIYDLTYGKGDFFNYLPTESNIYGTEIDMKAVKIAQYLYPKANLQYGDIRQYSPVLSGDIVFGNPPFHLEWGTKEAPVSSQMYYCKKAYQVLKNGGLLVLLVPESFLSDDFSNKGDIEEINHMFNLIVQFSLPADAFKEYGVTSFRTKAMILQKKSQYVTERPYTNTIAMKYLRR